jgi:hypothetical protein
MSLIHELGQLLFRILGLRRWVAVRSEDLPDAPKEGRIYLVGEPDRPWSAALLCPCGCGEIIQLSLLRDDAPSWRVNVAPGGAVTLHPSIWRIRGCRSHFFIRSGRLIWAPERMGVTPVPAPTIIRSQSR